MRFSKYHGAGNDFVMIADLEGRLGARASLAPDLVSALCDRHRGVGADGVIRIMGGAPDAEYYMDYYNADGGAAEMCGNGIRCLIVHELRAGRLDEGVHDVMTRGGRVTTRTMGRRRVTANMGTPQLLGRHTAHVAGTDVPGLNVSMSNPHFVVFLSEFDRRLDDDTVLGFGRRLEVHRDFPNRTNVEFVEIVDATRIRVRVWERGIGETLACGSGACAAAVAAVSLDRVGPHLIVDMPGGELEVEWEAGGPVWLTGPAEEVFTGEIDPEWLETRGLSHHAALVQAS